MRNLIVFLSLALLSINAKAAFLDSEVKINPDTKETIETYYYNAPSEHIFPTLLGFITLSFGEEDPFIKTRYLRMLSKKEVTYDDLIKLSSQYQDFHKETDVKITVEITNKKDNSKKYSVSFLFEKLPGVLKHVSHIQHYEIMNPHFNSIKTEGPQLIKFDFYKNQDQALLINVRYAIKSLIKIAKNEK